MNGQGGVVRLNDGVRDLGRGDDGEGSHHAVGELLTDLGDQQGTHTGTGTTAERVSDLETLEAVTALSLTTDNVENLVDKFGTLSVVTLGPVVTGSRLTENKVVGAEKLAKGAGTDGVHGTGLKIDEDSTRNILVARSLVEVDVHPLELEIGGAIVQSRAIESMLAGDGLPGVSMSVDVSTRVTRERRASRRVVDLPEGCTNLVTALTSPIRCTRKLPDS